MDIGPHQFHFMAQQVPTELKEKLVQPVQVDLQAHLAQKADRVVLRDLREHKAQSARKEQRDLRDQRAQSAQSARKEQRVTQVPLVPQAQQVL